MEKSSTKDWDNNATDHPAYSWGNEDTTTSLGSDGGGELFSWPPRSYTCTFCKREFRSAQALGGHMNVHRRDRARLRQMPRDHHHHHHHLSLPHPHHNYTFLNPNPNPNPNLTSFSPPYLSSPTTTMGMFPPSPSSLQPNMPSYAANSTTMMKSQIPSFVVHKYDAFRNKIINKSEIIRLNLEIGLLGESKSDDLDLELRLGVS